MKITSGYRDLLMRMHIRKAGWGSAGARHADDVRRIVRLYGETGCLDYGCGKQALAAACPELTVIGYDPAIPGLEHDPEPHPLVVCLDVLEHVEPECLDAVLNDIARCAVKAAYFVISTRLAHAVLPDGRNAHLNVQDEDYWREALWRHFKVMSMTHASEAQELKALCIPKGVPGR